MTKDDGSRTGRDNDDNPLEPATPSENDDSGLFGRSQSDGGDNESSRNRTPDHTPADTAGDSDQGRKADHAPGDNNPVAMKRAARVKKTVDNAFSTGARSVLRTYLPAIFVVFLLIAAAGGFLVYGAQTAPETTTETRTVGSWSPNATFSHGAVVTNGTFTFTEGQRLQNRPLYFTRISPELTGEYLLTHRGDAETANGTVDLRLVIEAVDESSGSEQANVGPTVYWQQTRPIDTVPVESLGRGETQRVSFEANVSELNERVSAIEESLGASPGTTRIAVVAETSLEASVAGDRFVDTRVDRLELEPSGGTYGVSSSLTESQSYEATETVEVPVGPTPLQEYGGPVLLAVGVVGMLVTGGAWRVDLLAVGTTERARLDFSQARSDFDKWISEGSVPSREDRTVVELGSLRDLVNVAIDSNRRVIERPDATPRYVVLDDDVRYVFDPPLSVLDREAAEATPGRPSDEVNATTAAETDAVPEDRTRDPNNK